MEPRLSESEIAAVEAAYAAGHTLKVSQHPSGSFIAEAGGKRLFASGGRQSFDKLWNEAKLYRPRMAAKELAGVLWGVLSAKNPHSTKWLAEKAELDLELYETMIPLVLDRLTTAGKLEKVVVSGKERWKKK